MRLSVKWYPSYKYIKKVSSLKSNSNASVALHNVILLFMTCNHQLRVPANPDDGRATESQNSDPKGGGEKNRMDRSWSFNCTHKP